MKLSNLIKLAEKNQNLRDKLNTLEEHNSNLDELLNGITNAKAFKLWQAYNKIKRNPTTLLKVISYVKKNGLTNVQRKAETINFVETSQRNINSNYLEWFNNNYPNLFSINSQKQTSFLYRPLISILTPVYNPDKEWLVKCIKSVINQSYSNWELCLVDDCSTKPHVREVLNYYAKKDERIKVVFRKQNGHISRASNNALEIATGEFIGLLDHDDEIWPNALFEIVYQLNKDKEIDFFYSDEDKIEMDGTHVDPFFKPDWSPDYLLSTNYITHFAVIRKSIIDDIKGFRVGYEGSQDYDLFLRVIEKTSKIYHLPKVLYSWRKVPNSTASVYTVKNYAHVAAKKALTDYLKRKHINAIVEEGIKLGTFKISYKSSEYSLVSIIIPTKDKVSLLKKCVKSIINKTDYPNFEIIIVDTGSQEKQTIQFYNDISSHKKVKIIYWKEPAFSFSRVNNFAADKAGGDYLLFLNNDTEVLDKQWLKEMVDLGQLQHAGPVGAKLVYADRRIQHAGIEILSNGWPHHYSINYPDHESYAFPYLNYKDVIKNPTAVTGACLLINKNKFLQLGSFDENFPFEFQDVLLSLKARLTGLIPIYTPYAKLVHHESQTIKAFRDWNRIISKFNDFKNIYGNFRSPFNPNIELIDNDTKSAVTQINQAAKVIVEKTPRKESTLQKKKILFITHLYWPSIGGAEKVFQTIAEKLTDHFDVTVLTSNVTSTDYYFKQAQHTTPPSQEETLNNVKIYRANSAPGNIRYLLWHKFGMRFKTLWLNYAALFFGPFFQKKITEKLIKENWEWIICGPAPTSALYYGKLFKNKTCTKLAVIPCMHTEDRLHTAKINISLIKQADLILTLTNNENDFLISHGVDKNKFLTIGVGVDDYLLNTPYQTFKEKDYILYIGQEGGHKNITLLIDAMINLWKKGYKHKLVIAGARTAFSPTIDEKISKLYDSYKRNIIRINNISNQQKIELLDNCLLMVNPSSYESFGIVFIEAWARKKPVIGAKIPAVSNLIKNNITGILFEDNKMFRLSEAIKSLIEDKEKAKSLAFSGYEEVITKYNWDKIISSIKKALLPG